MTGGAPEAWLLLRGEMGMKETGVGLLDLYSRRKRQLARAGEEDVYQYDNIPKALRVQICHLWDEGLNGHDFKMLAKVLRKEYGVFKLWVSSSGVYYGGDHDYRQELLNWFLEVTSVDRCLDAIELGARVLDANRERTVIDEMNDRIQEAGVGYRYEIEPRLLVRVDSQFVHAEVVKPLLGLLNDQAFASANQEFLEAHRLYRDGSGEQALTECCKAFESTLKIVAARRGWPVSEHATAKGLLDAAFSNGLVPQYLQGEFAALRALLESGVPTIRNKGGGHGAGTTPRTTPSHLVAFQLHQTAAAMLFLIEADRAKP